jgi:hypothetical protein
MSQENVEIVRRILTNWGQGDFAAPLNLFDSKIAFETFMPAADENVIANGIAQFAAFTRD